MGLWTIERIEREWGPVATVLPEIFVNSFDRVDKILGADWIEATRQALMGQIRTPGSVLAVVSMGGRLTVTDVLTGAGKLIARLQARDPTAEAELTAMYILHCRDRRAPIDYEPDGPNGRKCDFRIRNNSSDWTYVEVTRPDVSEVRERLTATLNAAASVITEIKREFTFEIFFKREPVEDELAALLPRIKQVCESGQPLRQEIDDLATLVFRQGSSGVITPEVDTGPDVPKLAVAAVSFGPNQPKRQVIARIAYADGRADKFLTDKAAQLPKDYPGLIMVDASAEPTVFVSWGTMLARRFQPGIHTRVSGLCLFAPYHLTVKDSIIWAPAAKLHINPNARIALPKWIRQALGDAADVFRRVSTGEFDAKPA